MRQAPQHRQNRGGPFRELPSPSPPLPVDDHEGIDTDRRVVHEGAAVDLGEVDGPGIRRGNHRDGAGEARRDAEVLGEVVQGPERQDAEGMPVPESTPATV